MRMLLVTNSILPASLKWQLANCAAYNFITSCVKSSFFSKFSHKTSFTFQLVDAMGLEDESCKDKVKEMYPGSDCYYSKVRINLQEM